VRPAPPPARPAVAARPAHPAWLALVLALAAVFAWRDETSLDLGFHVVSGRWIAAHHAWPRLDPFTYTLADRPYVDLHGLFQLAAAFAWGAGGAAGVGVLRVALALAAVAVLWRTATRRGAGAGATTAAVFALGLCAWEMRFLARPEMATYVLLALQLHLLDRHAGDRRRRWLAGAVLVQLAWTWSHALALFGPAVLGLYAVCDTAVRLARRRAPDPAPWAALALGVAALFANPYGARGVAFMWELRTRIESGNVFAESIGELVPAFSPQTAGFLPVLAFRALLVLTVVAVLARVRRLRAFDVALVAVFGWLAATHVRNIGLFAVATLPVAAVAATALLRARPAVARVAAAATAFAIVVVAAAVVGGGWYSVNDRPMRFGSREADAVYPVGNVARLGALGLHGPLYNGLGHGGYVLLHLWPRERAFIDGRLEVIGDDFYHRYLALQSGAGWREAAQQYGWNAAIVPYESIALARAINADSSWTVLGVDGVSVLLARKPAVPQPVLDSAWTVIAARNAPVPPAAERLLPSPLPPPPARAFARRMFPFGAWGRGNGYAMLGLLHAARREYADALRHANGDERSLVSNYAIVCARLGRTDEAAAWFRRMLEVDPHDAGARRALAALGR